MQKLMILKYLMRIEDEAENVVITEKNRVHWRKATSEDYIRIALATARLEQISAISRDIYNIFRLYE